MPSGSLSRKNPDGKGVTVKAPAYDGFKAREAKGNYLSWRACIL